MIVEVQLLRTTVSPLIFCLIDLKLLVHAQYNRLKIKGGCMTVCRSQKLHLSTLVSFKIDGQEYCVIVIEGKGITLKVQNLGFKVCFSLRV